MAAKDVAAIKWRMTPEVSAHVYMAVFVVTTLCLKGTYQHRYVLGSSSLVEMRLERTVALKEIEKIRH